MLVTVAVDPLNLARARTHILMVSDASRTTYGTACAAAESFGKVHPSDAYMRRE